MAAQNFKSKGVFISTSTGASLFPFFDVTSFSVPESEASQETELSLPAFQATSPFATVYEVEGGEQRIDLVSEEFVQFLNELHDEKFEEAVFELISEASALYEDRFAHEYRGTAAQTMTMEAEWLLGVHFAPLERELEKLVESVANDIEHRDFDSMTEAEIDAFVESFQPTQELSPSFENLFGWAKKKLKKAARWAKKKVKALARKAFQAALKKLKKYIKPWLKKSSQLRSINNQKIPAIS